MCRDGQWCEYGNKKNYIPIQRSKKQNKELFPQTLVQVNIHDKIRNKIITEDRMENDRSMQRRKLHTQNKGAEDRTREEKQ